MEPHITVIFPFESDLSDEALIEHVSTKIASMTSFDASLYPQPTSESGYVYFPIDVGVEQVAALHNFLYVGPLAQFRRDCSYTPHVTIGRARLGKAQQILEEATKLDIETEFGISRLKIERIGTHGESEIISQLNLGLGI